MAALPFAQISAISDTLHGVIDEVSEENGGKLTILPSGNVWSTDLDKLKIIPVQGGFSLQQLTPDQAELVVTDWENAGKGALPYVKALINNYLSLGLLNENQQFVGWMLETNYGTIGLLQVLKEFRGQGYSKVLVSNLAKMVLETGRQVHVYIHPTNDISVNLHKGLGFVCHAGSSSWLRHDPK